MFGGKQMMMLSTASSATKSNLLKGLLAVMILSAALLSGCAPTEDPSTPPPPTAPVDQVSTPGPAAAQASPTFAAAASTEQPEPTEEAGLSPTEALTASQTSTQSNTATASQTPAASDTPQPASVESIPDPGQYEWVLAASGFSQPVGLEYAPDGSGRLFVLEQPGVIRLIEDGQAVNTPFLDIRDRVDSSASEQGLLGLAFHPNYQENGYFFINYTGRGGNTFISRFQVSDDPNRADSGSEQNLLTIEQPYANHNGGVVVFGPDGYLYLGLGDGGSGGDPQGRGQSLDTLLGKILRVNVDSNQSAPHYSIPADNPFADGGGRPEIWAYGLRNPWRISFDSLTGDLYIADVGQNTWEEVNIEPADSPGGQNYGWNIMEANACFQSRDCPMDGLVLPIHSYGTRSEGNCSVTGGYVYRGSVHPELQGVYLFGDYCSGRVWGLLSDGGGGWQNQLMFETGARITSFGLDQGGELYLVNHRGEVYRLEKGS
jgi:glucose/arabinose dehydrogenase